MPAETTTTTFESAFEAAVAEHSKEPAPTAEPVVEETAGGDTPAATTSETTPQQTEKAADEGVTAEEAESLLSKAELETIRRMPPEQQYKAMNRAFTQKTQALAAERKELQQAKMVVEALQKDPKGALEALGKHYGINFGTEQTKQAQESSVDAMVSKMREALGPELDFLADKIAPVMQEMAKSLVEEQVKPVKEWQERAAEDQRKLEVETILEKFTAKHPDWKQPEIQSKMDELAKELEYRGKDQMKYLELLYSQATRNRSEAEQTKNIIKKMTAAEKNSEPSDNGVSAHKISQTAPKFKGLDDAFDSAHDAAKRGIVWDS